MRRGSYDKYVNRRFAGTIPQQLAYLSQSRYVVRAYLMHLSYTIIDVRYNDPRPLTRRKNSSGKPLLSRIIVSAFLKSVELVVLPWIYFLSDRKIIARGILTIRAISQTTERTSDRSRIESGTSKSMSTTKQFSALIIWQALNLIGLGSSRTMQSFGNRNRILIFWK